MSVEYRKLRCYYIFTTNISQDNEAIHILKIFTLKYKLFYLFIQKNYIIPLILYSLLGAIYISSDILIIKASSCSRLEQYAIYYLGKAFFMSIQDLLHWKQIII